MGKKVIGLVGTGMIASSMAVLTAGHGLETYIFTRSKASEERCSGAVKNFFGQIQGKGFMTEDQIQKCLSLIHYVYSYEEMASVNLVFESIVEEAAAKYEVYKKLEECCNDIKAICSVTSSIVPNELAKGCSKYKDRILVTHPFNPPHMVPYFEVCGSDFTSEECVEYVMESLKELDRKPVRLNKPTKGFIGNRLQFALWREALALVEEGICEPEAIDTCLAYSFCPRFTSIGIFEHFDTGGLELNAATCKNVWPILSTATDIPDFMQKLMDEGKMGAKSESKTGFYDWNDVDMEEYQNRVSKPYWDLFEWKTLNI